ncbi:MAG: sensor histidine kinase, partial [Patescibacteria group bacterium]
YTKEKGLVTISVSEVGKRTRFEVTDSGIGIPKSEQAHLFGKFYRGSNAAKLGFEGTGLGLYTVKCLVERLGGTLGFTSEEGKGSTFWVEL